MSVAALTSVSSYQSGKTDVTLDVSPVYAPLLSTFAGPFGAVGTAYRSSVDKFTQEVRLTSRVPGPLDWLVGAFYTHESADNGAAFILYNPALQLVPNDVFTYSTPSVYKEYAAFGDLTWHLTTKLDVTGGLRFARNEQEETQYGRGLIGLSHPPITSSDHVFTYLGNARYHFGDHTTGYLRYATGYRPGGPNLVTSATQSSSFQADTLKSYEAGLKTETADHRLSVDLAGYYSNWTNVQVEVVRNGFGAYANASGGAGIDGAELSATVRPIPGLTLGSAFALQHAYLKQDEPILGGTAGERLPNVPRFTGSVNGEYVLPGTPWKPTLGASVHYVGNRDASFNNATGYLQYYLPSYTTVDARGEVTLQSVTVQLYGHNLGNARGELSALNWRGPAMPAIQQPRTFGVSFVRKF
jgi:outer membrane receptor protein involved in Fe transport